MSSQPQPLSVAIVGAGIAGLTAALSLQKHGHQVTVFEQSRLASEIGAAFNITPNACAVLSSLGIDVFEGGAVNYKSRVHLDSKSGQQLADIPRDSKLVGLPKGEEWVLAHRYHLHKQLKDAVVARGIDLVTSKRVASVQPEKMQINFSDGSSHTTQVVIGADGVHSKVREALYSDVAPFVTPWAAFRFILNRADIDSHEGVFGDDLFQPGTMYIWGNPDTQIIAYPMSSGTQMNFVCLFPTKVLGIDAEHDSQYSHTATKDQLLSVYHGFEPRVQELLRMADPDHLRYWPLMDMANLPSYVSGRIALTGDASHPFLPFAAQGASMAIEDGAAVAAMLAGTQRPDEVEPRLALYETLRHERCSREQQFSRDLFRDHSHDTDWDPVVMFNDIYLYRVLDEAEKLKERHGFASR